MYARHVPVAQRHVPGAYVKVRCIYCVRIVFVCAEVKHGRNVASAAIGLYPVRLCDPFCGVCVVCVVLCGALCLKGVCVLWCVLWCVRCVVCVMCLCDHLCVTCVTYDVYVTVCVVCVMHGVVCSVMFSVPYWNAPL